MKTAPVRVLIVDDDENEASSFVDLLNASGADLEVSDMRPEQNVEATANAVCDTLGGDGEAILLLDYRLEDHPESEEPVNYRGGTVAGYVRDKEPDLPIVLFTSEDKLHKFVERRAGMEDVFDWTLIKSDVISSEDGAARAGAQLADLARGWTRAKGWPDDQEGMWERMAQLMEAPDQDMALFRDVEAAPPRGDVAGHVTHWLLRALSLPGPLIDEAATRVTLGLSEESFAKAEVSAWIEDCGYTGALAAFGPRWWAHRVREHLSELSDGTRPLDASDRAASVARELGIALDPEFCSWCGGERTLRACAVCNRATDAAHALRPLGEPLPAWADALVICYRCVADGSAAEWRFPPRSHDVVDGLTEGRIEPPKQ
jgi:CheY-like chemotaxis protein